MWCAQTEVEHKIGAGERKLAGSYLHLVPDQNSTSTTAQQKHSVMSACLVPRPFHGLYLPRARLPERVGSGDVRLDS